MQKQEGSRDGPAAESSIKPVATSIFDLQISVSMQEFLDSPIGILKTHLHKNLVGFEFGER